MAIVVPFRLNAWILQVLSSAITVISLIDERQDDKSWQFEVFWTVILVSITGGLATIMGCIHGVATLRHHRVGMNHRWELAAIMLTVVGWVMAIPVIMNPDNRLAISENTMIIDANLYFASWWGFICSFALFVYHGAEAMSQNVSREWVCLAIASLITTMAASHRIDQGCAANNNETNNDCARLRLSISLSVFSAVCAAVVAICFFFEHFLAKFLRRWILLIVSVLVLGLWTVLVALTTFKDGPAKQVGTLFFGIWASALLSLYICLQHLYGIFHPESNDLQDSVVEGHNKQTNDNCSQPETSREASRIDAADPHFPDIETGNEHQNRNEKWWKTEGEPKQEGSSEKWWKTEGEQGEPKQEGSSEKRWKTEGESKQAEEKNGTSRVDLNTSKTTNEHQTSPTEEETRSANEELPKKNTESDSNAEQQKSLDEDDAKHGDKEASGEQLADSNLKQSTKNEGDGAPEVDTEETAQTPAPRNDEVRPTSTDGDNASRENISTSKEK